MLSTFLLLGTGVLMVFSTTAVTSLDAHGDAARMLRHHFIHITLGLAVFLACLMIPPERLYRIAVPMLLVSIVLLFLTLIPGIGHVAGGARRWLILGPLRFQAGELAKLASVIYFASYVERRHAKMHGFVSGVAIPSLVLGMLSVLLLLEPDFGSTVIILSVVFCQLFMVCRLKHVAFIAAFVAMSLATLVILSPYRMKRFISFLDPFNDATASGYQLVQSLIAVGSGGLTGAGLGAGKQKLFYLPAAHTDFIFAVIAEELGTAGAVSVLLLFLVILYRGLRLSKRLLDRPYLASLALGCTLLMVIPAILNMGVVLGLLPTKGLVLPLVAYGGTAMIVHLAIVGILLRLSKSDT